MHQPFNREIGDADAILKVVDYISTDVYAPGTQDLGCLLLLLSVTLSHLL
jgi:hypothetical protein